MIDCEGSCAKQPTKIEDYREHVRKLLDSKGLTVGQLAEALYVSKSFLVKKLDREWIIKNIPKEKW